MADSIFTNKYFVMALLVIIIVLLYLYSQTRNCINNNNYIKPVENMDNLNNDKKMDDDIEWNDYMNYYTLLEFGGDNYGRFPRRKSTINGIPQPLDMRPDLSQCQPCRYSQKIE